jgi:hypothetical protein
MNQNLVRSILGRSSIKLHSGKKIFRNRPIWKELPVAAMFANELGRNEQSL